MKKSFLTFSLAIPLARCYFPPVMTTTQLFEVLGTRQRGAIATVISYRPCKTRKGSPAVTKRTQMQMRLGHNYENQASTIEARENGREKLAPEQLWHEPCPEVDGGRNLFRRHKTNGQIYLFGQPSGNPARSQFFLDGKPVSYAEVEDFLLASEKRDGEVADYLCHKVENIEAVNGVGSEETP
jgi:hypothetical protein